MSEQVGRVREIGCELLFDGEKLVENAHVTIEDGRIGEVVSVSGKNGRRTPEVTARFLMPGLIDSHVHCIGFTEGMPGGAPFKPLKHFMRLCVYNGVTSVRDTGNTLETIFYLRQWTQKYQGPRVFASGPLLDAPPFTWAHSRLARDGAEARREVGRLARDGVDLIKAYRNTEPEVVGAIVEAASECGLPVAIDSEATSASQASALGVRSIEHASNLREADPELPQDMLGRVRAWSRFEPESAEPLAKELVANGTFVVPTLLVSRRWCLLDEMVGDPYLDYMVPVMPYHRYFKQMRGTVGRMIGKRFMKQYMPVPDLDRSERAEVELGLDRMGELVSYLRSEGVKIAAGTDTPNPSLAPGFSLHQELAEMVRHGLSPADALVSATSSAASLLGREELGLVRPGALADLLLIDGNPTENIEDLGKIQGVLKGGEQLDLEKLRAKLQESIEEAVA